MKKSLSLCAAAALLLQCSLSHAELTRIGAAAAVAGRVEAVSQGEAVGRVMQSGKPLFLNDHVTSGPDSRLQVMLLDQTIFTLGPDSDMVLDEFVYDPSTNAGKVTARVTKGIFRFVTGKVAQKTPENMKVKLPTATIGIRGTIVFGSVQDGHAVVGLGGPGFNNNTGDRYGGISVSNAQGSSDISRPGYGTIIDAGKPPTPPAPLPPGILNQISAGLTPPKSAGGPAGNTPGSPSFGSRTSPTPPSGSPGDATGQTVAVSNNIAGNTDDQVSLSQALTNTATQANQDTTAAAATNVTDFGQFASIPGSGRYNSSGAFTQTLSGGSPCSIAGTWSYDFTVNFAALSASGSASISAGTISDAAVINQHFPSSGSASFTQASGSGGTYNFTFTNGSSGSPAATVQGTSSFSSGGNAGTGATVTAPKGPPLAL